MVTRRDVSKLCLLKRAVSYSCTRNWDDLDHCQLFLQRRITLLPLTLPSPLTLEGNAGGFWAETTKVWRCLCKDETKAHSSHLNFFFFFFYFPLLQEPCFNSFHALVFLNDKPNAHFCLSRSPASAESLNATTSAKPSQPPAVSAKHHPCLAGQAYSYTSWLALRGFKLWQVNRPFVLVTWVDVVAIIVNLSFWIVQVCSSNPNVPLPSFNILKWVFSWKFSWLIPWVNGPRVLFDFL